MASHLLSPSGDLDAVSGVDMPHPIEWAPFARGLYAMAQGGDVLVEQLAG